jgi:hypothetical protein
MRPKTTMHQRNALPDSSKDDRCLILPITYSWLTSWQEPQKQHLQCLLQAPMTEKCGTYGVREQQAYAQSCGVHALPYYACYKIAVFIAGPFLVTVQNKESQITIWMNTDYTEAELVTHFFFKQL